VDTEETPITPVCEIVLRGSAAGVLPDFVAELERLEEPAARGGV